MDYEKKYNEALERFKTFREKYCTYGDLHFGDVIFDKTGEAQKDLDAIFPELRESEDERIRKVLVNEISGWSDVYKMFKYAPKEKVLAWLEKHKELIDPFDTKLFQDGVKEGRRLEREDMEKEQKPILEVFGFKVGDAVRLKDGDGRKHIIESFEEVEGLHGPNFYHVEFEDNSARSGIYTGEEYPNGYYTQMEKFEEEQKPASSGSSEKPNNLLWSEEDERMKQDIIQFIKTGWTDNGKSHLIPWLKSLPERFNLTSKQEWSDEDERIVRFYEADYNNQIGDMSMKDVINMRLEFKNWLINRLKSIRPSKDCSGCAKNLEGYISGRSNAENKLLEQFGALITPEDELHIKPRWKPSEEQMEALSDAYVEASTFKKGDILESLYDQLKKL